MHILLDYHIELLLLYAPVENGHDEAEYLFL